MIPHLPSAVKPREAQRLRRDSRTYSTGGRIYWGNGKDRKEQHPMYEEKKDIDDLIFQGEEGGASDR